MRTCRCVFLVMLLAVALPALAASQWQEGVALTRDGAKLLYDGKPFAAVGVNKHELLDQYIAKELGKSAEEAKAARAAAKQSLERLSALGVTVVRVRMSAFWPAQIERTYLSEDESVRAAFWASLDDMLDDCDKCGLRVVATITWHTGGWADIAHESLTDLFTDRASLSRQLLNKWIEDLVGRCKGRDTILFWELTNEANLGADLRPMFAAEGMLKPMLGKGPVAHLVTEPVIRDGRNNYSSDDLAGLTADLCRLIKSLDPGRLVGTGFSAPRRAAWHLWQGSRRGADKMDWTVDTPEQQAEYLRVITPEEVDLISLHTYGGPFDRALDLKLAADDIGKPVYIGELGMSAKTFEGRVYDSPQAIEGLRIALEAMRAMGVPLSLLWTWDEWGRPIHEPVLRPESQPEVVEVLRVANLSAERSAADQPTDAEAVRARVQELYAELEALNAASK